MFFATHAAHYGFNIVRLIAEQQKGKKIAEQLERNKSETLRCVFRSTG